MYSLSSILYFNLLVFSRLYGKSHIQLFIHSDPYDKTCETDKVREVMEELLPTPERIFIV